MAKLTIAAPMNYRQAFESLMGQKNKKIGHNTELVFVPASGLNHAFIAAKLHGSQIVRWFADGTRAVSWAGFPTATTRDRLTRLVPDHHFNIRKGEGYVDGEETLGFGWTVL